MIWASLAIFGMIGVFLRFFVINLIPGSSSWLSTLIVNLIGSMFAGYFYGTTMVNPEVSMFPIPDWFRIGITVGLLGAFTTFSSYSLDLLKMLQAGTYLLAAAFLICNNLFSLGICFLGYKFAIRS